MNKLEVGKIVNTHGLRGEVKVVPYTDFPDDFEKLKKVYVNSKNSEIVLNISSIKYQKDNLIIKFKEITSIDDAIKYKNMILECDRSQLGELSEGVYYIVDIIGCTVIDEDENEIGKIVDVFTAGGGNVYDIKRDGMKNMLLPTSNGVVLSTDIENKIIRVKIPDGLLDLD